MCGNCNRVGVERALLNVFPTGEIKFNSHKINVEVDPCQYHLPPDRRRVLVLAFWREEITPPWGTTWWEEITPPWGTSWWEEITPPSGTSGWEEITPPSDTRDPDTRDPEGETPGTQTPGTQTGGHLRRTL